jgi:hypothetical protein
VAARRGYVDGVMKSEIDIEALHSKRLRLFGVSNELRTPGQRAATVRGFVADLLPAIADGRIRPVLDQVFPFVELPAAKAHMESNAHLGKIVVRASSGRIHETGLASHSIPERWLITKITESRIPKIKSCSPAKSPVERSSRWRESYPH